MFLLGQYRAWLGLVIYRSGNSVAHQCVAYNSKLGPA